MKSRKSSISVGPPRSIHKFNGIDLLNNLQSGNIGSCVAFEGFIIYSTKLQNSSLSKISSIKNNKEDL